MFKLAMEWFVFLEFLLEDSLENKLIGRRDTLPASMAVIQSTLRRKNIPKIVGYAENVVPSYQMDDFKSIFRMSCGIFEQLVTMVGNSQAAAVEVEQNGGRQEIPIPKICMIAVYYITNQEFIRSIAERFGITSFSVLKARCLLRPTSFCNEQI